MCVIDHHNMVLAVEVGLNPNTTNQFPKQPNLDTSKLKEFVDNNFRFNENGKKLFKTIETLGEKEKLLKSNFSFSHSAF